MTTIKFKPGDRNLVIQSELKHVYAVDAMLISYHAEATDDGELIEVTVGVEQSCRLYFPWPDDRYANDENTEPRSWLMLPTSCLPGRDTPYQYELELARGTIGSLLEKFATWRESGTNFSDEANESVARCRDALADAIYSQTTDEMASSASAAIKFTLRAIDLLVQEHAQTVLKTKKQVALGVNVGQQLMQDLTSEQAEPAQDEAADNLEFSESVLRKAAARKFVGQFQNAILQLPDQNDQPMSADIEFINRSRITIGEVWRMRGSHSEIGVGPVLDWRTISIDEWFDDETDLEVIRQNLFNWGESFGRQLSPDVCPVHVAAGIGARVSSRFNDQQRLQLTLDTMCGINQGNEELQQMVSFYQPLGDEIDAHAMAVSPLHAADALQRTDVGLQRLGLEIMFSDAAVPSNRNLLMLDSQIQAWNQFDLPLTIILNFPGWDCLGNAAKNNTAKNNTAKNNTAKNNTDEDLSSQRLLQEVDNLLALLDSKTIVDRVCFAPTSVVGLDVVKDENRVCFADLVSRIVARRNETMQSV